MNESVAGGTTLHWPGPMVLVLARDGVQVTGSPWWTDSLEVKNGEMMYGRLPRQQPGPLVGSLPQLAAARQGLIAHLMYQDVTTPFRLGRHTANHPE
jgi:hypothetical protein